MGTWVYLLAALGVMLVLKVLLSRRAPPEVVKAKLDAGATVLDVRSREEFGGGAYPKARNIPVHELGGRLEEVPKGKPVVCYCASGMRSAMAVRMLRRAGLDAVNAGTLAHLPPR